MIERRVQVKLKLGLQARQAALFVQEANRFSADIFLEKDEKKVNAKSIMGVMSLAVAKGTEVTLSSEGNDAEQAVTALATLIEKED
ncbi:HPr family phosphocarrier protein [Lysinibacillus irui]|uniref:HPr family phosphocarrier protein n=1 Tax=Lysinibacillus irui TaxID=2998077 RepID=A0AAJ5RNC1_9BACI|nr:MULTISPECIES: HPr family phosphocarrier protein [Lysinibacillus]MEA0553633.1 HPr family phosphocarrier protein [Lysinibacillus irui]MEA0564420.1 HPr family phosphocarrier protein [Lysinibacillus irui]MEA0976017.1 HPr family phosphocarrier protein [Lysinibacillus irui]MEA1042171.1 HPr family phosphocarrier protein [Lysinibacillus irui]WDV06200.1 HPr family phosphocarrier protein [Lysinibacillus irui]